MQKFPQKILVYSLPRSGTTVIQSRVSHTFKIPNLVEPFNDPSLGFNQLIKTQSCYSWIFNCLGIVKLLSINLDRIDPHLLMLNGGFEHVIFINRKDLTSCCLSLCYAQLTSKYHYQQSDNIIGQSFYCPIEFVDRWIFQYRLYVLGKSIIESYGLPSDYIVYEDFIKTGTLNVAGHDITKDFLPFVSTNFNYQEMCTNFDEVNQMIMSVNLDSTC
jgi:hypothetical protein